MSEVPPSPEPHETPAEQPAPAPEPVAEPVAAAAEPAPAATPTPSAPMGGPSQEEKMYGMLAWLLGIPTAFVAPLIFFLISNDKPFAKRHAAMALGVQIITIIGSMISGVLMVVLIGLLILPVVVIGMLIFSIMGAIAANKGEAYDPPVIGPMIANMLKV